jgi:hypothetical protein
MLNNDSTHITTSSDEFPKLRKATISFVMCIRPSVHIKQLGSASTGRILMKLFFFRKSIEKKFKSY